MKLYLEVYTFYASRIRYKIAFNMYIIGIIISSSVIVFIINTTISITNIIIFTIIIIAIVINFLIWINAKSNTLHLMLASLSVLIFFSPVSFSSYCMKGAQLTKWFSAWTNNPHSMRVWVRIQHGAKEK